MPNEGFPGKLIEMERHNINAGSTIPWTGLNGLIKMEEVKYTSFKHFLLDGYVANCSLFLPPYSMS